MKRFIKIMSIFSIILVSLFFLFPTNNNSNTIFKNDTSNKYNSSVGYTITKYDIVMNVNEYNYFDITETITANFTGSEKHGIIRSIPYYNKVYRTDGSSSTTRAKITNISVDNSYSTSTEDGNLKIKIGDADKVVSGNVTYVIKYRYDLRRDPLTDKDELYYNIIGTEWDTTISNVTFSITMPKEIDASKVGMSKGSYGTSGNFNTYQVYNNIEIRGSYTGTLNAKEGITVRCELPEGYFLHQDLPTFNYIIVFIPILFIFIAAFIWFKFGRGPKFAETVEFYPPNGLNSLEVGFVYKGEASNKDAMSLLIYLANKGYIEIIEDDHRSDQYTIKKLKSYDGDDFREGLFMEGLFKSSDEVNKIDLINSFYHTIKRILSDINVKTGQTVSINIGSRNIDEVYDREKSNYNDTKNINKTSIIGSYNTVKKVIIGILILLTFLIMLLPPLFDYSENIIILFVFSALGIAIFTSSITMKTVYFRSRIVPFIVGAVFTGVSIPLGLGEALLFEKIYLIGFIIGVISIIIMMFFLFRLKTLSEYGAELKAKVNGFRHFLITAEKDKLEKLVMENPNYFYDILPYTYVLGISNKWIQKFETIVHEPPTWYYGHSSFSIYHMSTFMSTTITSTASTYTARSTGGSGGHSGGGGGFSGGGSGGGGGSSW